MSRHAALCATLRDALPQVNRASLGFATRTTAASLIALYIAFLLDLDDPKWAAMTVWIVAQGSRGMSASKGQYRIAGSGIGAIVGVTLIALFAQAPALFIVALAGWLGLCTGAATALRNFRAYGAVLAGYTAAIVGMDAVTMPDHVFDIAIARVIYIVLGIVVEGVLTAVFAPGTPVRDVQLRLGAYIRQAATLCARALRGEANGVALHRFFASAVELDAFAEYAAAGSSEVGHGIGHLRAATTATLTQLAAAQSLRDALSLGNGDAASPFLDRTKAVLDRVAGTSVPDVRRAPDALETLDAIALLREQVRHAFATEARAIDATRTAYPLLLDRLNTLLSALHDALTRQSRQSRSARTDLREARSRFSFHVDLVASLHNGLRAFFAVLAASACWIFTAWPSGPGFVTIVCVVCALFATRANAIAGGLGFLKGAVWAAMLAGLCDFLLLPAVSDFAMLALIAGTCMVGAGLAMRQPRTAASGASFAIFFWDLISPQNNARIDASGFFNGTLSLLVGMACGTLVFALVFPSNPQASRRRLQRAVRRDLARIGRRPTTTFTTAAWLTRTADRLGRQLALSDSTGDERTEKEIRGILAAWAIGDAATALRTLASHTWAAHHPRIQGRLTALLQRLGDDDPPRLARACRRYAMWLMRLGDRGASEIKTHEARHRPHRPHRPSPPSRHDLLRAATLLLTIAEAAGAHADFLKG